MLSGTVPVIPQRKFANLQTVDYMKTEKKTPSHTHAIPIAPCQLPATLGHRHLGTFKAGQATISNNATRRHKPIHVSNLLQ